MCRVLAYLGRSISLEHLLFTTDSSLVRQTYSPRMMKGALNLAGFGMAAWDESSRAPEEPFIYRTTSMPVYDSNLRGLAQKIAPSCVVAHVRGVSWTPEATIAEQNLHPFRYPGVSVALAHNGHLREFTEMRHDLQSADPGWARRSRARFFLPRAHRRRSLGAYCEGTGTLLAARRSGASVPGVLPRDRPRFIRALWRRRTRPHYGVTPQGCRLRACLSGTTSAETEPRAPVAA